MKVFGATAHSGFDVSRPPDGAAVAAMVDAFRPRQVAMMGDDRCTPHRARGGIEPSGNRNLHRTTVSRHLPA